MIRVLQGDCRDVLKSLPEQSVHCVVTSPPYFGLRDYGVAGQIGLEPTPDAYVAEMVAVFREVRRVLRDDGTLWLNLGDSYASGEVGRHDSKSFSYSGSIKDMGPRQQRKRPEGCKPKDLQMIPAQVALALRADGWYLRSHIIWHKPNPMPESVTDRPTSAHESIFLLTKRARYYYDADAVREGETREVKGAFRVGGSYTQGRSFNNSERVVPTDSSTSTEAIGRNLRNVWTIATQPFSGAHFATFPPDLIEPCIKAGTSEKGCCHKCGAPWVRNIREEPDDRTPYATVSLGEKACTAVGKTTGLNKVLREDGCGGDLATKKRWTTGWSPSCSCDAAADDPCTVLDPFGGAGTTGLVADRLQRNSILIELNPEYAVMAKSRLTADAGMFAAVEAATWREREIRARVIDPRTEQEWRWREEGPVVKNRLQTGLEG